MKQQLLKMSKNKFLYAMTWRFTPGWLSCSMHVPHVPYVPYVPHLPVASKGEWPQMPLRHNHKTVQGLCAGLFIQPIAQR